MWDRRIDPNADGGTTGAAAVKERGPMRLQLSPEFEAFREEMRTFFTTQVPQEIRDTVAAHRHVSKEQYVETQRVLNAAGLAVPHWPAEWGGRDWTPLQRHIWREEMQLAHVPEPLAFNTSMIGPVLAAFGNQEQKERFLPKTANLDIWWCQGFSEPDAGSDLASLRTTAVRDGDDWVVNGQKTWTTLGQHADWIFCLVRTDPTAEKKQRGISMLVFPMDSPGVTLRPIELIDGGFEVNEVFFEDVRVPAENLIGEENRGWDYAKFLLGNERVGIARVGSTKRLLAQAKEHARGITSGGRSLIEDPRMAARLGAAAGGHRAGRRHRRPALGGLLRRGGLGRARLGARRDAALPELPQGLHLRRLQRGAAHHHRRLDPGVVREVNFDYDSEQSDLREAVRGLL